MHCDDQCGQCWPCKGHHGDENPRWCHDLQGVYNKEDPDWQDQVAEGILDDLGWHWGPDGECRCNRPTTPENDPLPKEWIYIHE